MMEKDFVLALIQPFILKQKVSVYENGKCVETIKCRYDDLEDTIMNFVHGYNIHKINIAGQNILYSIKLKERLLAKYANNKDLEIDIF